MVHSKTVQHSCIPSMENNRVTRFPISPLRPMSRCAKLTTEEQRAKAREHQRRWREKLKQNVEKNSEYREQQKERTRIWKEKLRCDEQKYEEVSKKHQERCKRWWEKLTPEQRKEKRRQYNARWRQNRTKVDSDPDQDSSSIADPKDMVEICMDLNGTRGHTPLHPPNIYHRPCKSYAEVLMESEAANKTQPSHFYSKSARFKIPFAEEPLHRNDWILQYQFSER